MVVRSLHLLLSRRLLWHPRLSQTVADRALHGVEGWPDRRRLHAHGLGAVGPGLCHPAAAGVGVGICGDHGVRIRIYASHPDLIFRASDVDIIASYPKEEGYDHIRHACKLDRPRRAKSQGLAPPSGP